MTTIKREPASKKLTASQVAEILSCIPVASYAGYYHLSVDLPNLQKATHRKCGPKFLKKVFKIFQRIRMNQAAIFVAGSKLHVVNDVGILYKYIQTCIRDSDTPTLEIGISTTPTVLTSTKVSLSKPLKEALDTFEYKGYIITFEQEDSLKSTEQEDLPLRQALN